MKKDDIKQITDKLEQGVKDVYESDNYKSFLDVLSKFHNYSLNNCILIAIQKPEATRVAGFNTWKKLNRHVKKGEKGIKIIAPCPHKIVEEYVENGETKEREVKWNSYRAVSVFDISQTDGEDLPDICKDIDGDVDGFDSLIKKLESMAPNGVEYTDDTGGANGYFSRATKKIVVKKSLSQAHKVKTLIHEIAHSIMHDDDDLLCDRNLREVQAESVAYVVASKLGVDPSQYSFEYIASWSRGKEVEELRTSADLIRTTAGDILDRLEVA